MARPWSQARELAAGLLHRDLSAVESKVVDEAAAAARSTLWRSGKLIVGFTNGCFDLLHPGYVSLLAQAKAACDKLIVGLNSDTLVTCLKGPNRPVQTEAARPPVMASMEGVDLVVVFDDDTPHALIEAIRPNVLVKGADYAKDDVVGADKPQRQSLTPSWMQPVHYGWPNNRCPVMVGDQNATGLR